MADFYLTVGGDTGHADSINLNDAATYIILDGTLDMATPGLVRWTQLVQGATADARIAAANTLFRLLRRAAQAERIGSGITFSMRRGAASAWNHFDLTGVTLDPERDVRVLPGGAKAEYDIEVSCYPYPRGDAISVTGDISGTKAGSTAAFLVTDIPGTVDALAHLELTDTSGSGVINRVRVGLIRGDFDAATDYTPWVDAEALTGATDTADANSLGGEYATRTITSTSHVDIARAVQPAGDRQRGRFDGYARVYSTGTAIGAGANLNGTVNDPDAVTTTSRVASDITVGATGSGQAATNVGSFTATWSATTQVGSLVLAIGFAEGGSSNPVPTGGTPAWKLLFAQSNLNVYYKRNAIAQSGTVTWAPVVTESATDPSNLLLIELIGADIITSVAGSSPTVANPIEWDSTAWATDAVTVANSSFEAEAQLAVVAFFDPSNRTTDLTDFWWSGYETILGANEVVVGMAKQPTIGTEPIRPKLTHLAGAASAARMITFRVKPTSSTSTSSTYQEPTPGELEDGTYTARVQAIDAAGYRGNASSSASDSVTTDRSSIDYTWDAVTNATAYALTIQFGSRFYEVITTGTSYELETLAGLREVAALPSTSGATAPPPRIRALVGTLNDHTMTELPEVALSGSGAFELVRLFSNRQLPPIDAPLSDTWVDYAVEVQGRSANGANATVRVDALWIVPCREPQAEAWIQGLAESTKRRWVLESHRSGKGVFGWLENTSGGAEVGRITTAGALLIPPGTSIVLLAFQQAADVHSFGAQVTASLTVFPRSRWELDSV